MSEEQTLEEVAATLLVKTEEPKAVAATPKPVPEGDDERSEETDKEQSEEESTEEAPDGESDDSETDNAEETEEDDVDVDELEIDVTVDGAEKKVKLKDLKANYSGNQAIEKRLQEASEARTQAVETSRVLYAALSEEAARLAKLDEVLQKVAEPEINWEELKRVNLPRYLLEKDKVRETEARREALTKERQRVYERQQHLENLAREEYTREQAKQLVYKMPELADREKAPVLHGKLIKAGENYGYTAEEVGGVLDHRAMLVLRDAQRYQELMANQKKISSKPAASTTLLRPSASKTAKPATQAKKLQEALVRKARSSGRVEDVAAMLVMRKK